MHSLEQFLKRAGRKIVRQKIGHLISWTVLAISLWLLLYAASILMFRGVSLTWSGLTVLPSLVLVALAVGIPVVWWRLRDRRRVARYLEERFEELQLSVSTSLDFLEGRVDSKGEIRFQDEYLSRVEDRLTVLDLNETPRFRAGRYATVAVAATLLIWGVFQDQLQDRFYNPASSFGQTHLNIDEGSITIFEPEYTQIPGRTLPLKPGRFSAYPGSKVRFMIQLPEYADRLFLLVGNEEEGAKPVPLRVNEQREVNHELVLLENTDLRFLISEDDANGRTASYSFQVKTDESPTVTLRSHTPEGPINVLDPLILEADVKDDFGIKNLWAVVNWGEAEEKRLDLSVPGSRRQHFITKQRWNLSDLGVEEAESFTLYLEASDNNPINGPGIGRSETLTYELESPEKKYDEFMELARKLLDTMTHTLGDNLETVLASAYDQDTVSQAANMGSQIERQLYESMRVTNDLIARVREAPNFNRLDQNFLHGFRNDLSMRHRHRRELGRMYSNIRDLSYPDNYRRLFQGHHEEELKIEGLTYELLLQLKLWAALDLERQNNKLREELEQLEEMLENGEEMDSDELQEMFNKLMDEIMKDFREMMARAAQEMETTVQEFMNSDAMQDYEDQFQSLREQIMQALKEGDMEKAKALMEEMKAQMEAAYNSMQNAMGEMSPEMQAMMKNMRELSGLLRELKANEEQLERETQSLKQKLDKEMGGNSVEVDPSKAAEYREATERIKELLSGLYNKLAEYGTDELFGELLQEIEQFQSDLENKEMNDLESNLVRRNIQERERQVEFYDDLLEKLQQRTLRDLEQTEKMQEYLDQGELMLALEFGRKLKSFFVHGEYLGERLSLPLVQEEARTQGNLSGGQSGAVQDLGCARKYPPQY